MGDIANNLVLQKFIEVAKAKIEESDNTEPDYDATD